MSSSRRATGLVSVAYTWWGLSALYWRELASVAPIDQLAFRVSIAAAFLLAIWALWRRNPFRSIGVRHFVFGTIAALSISTNWAVFLWAVANEQAVEAALGYFLMPLFSVAIGVGALGERLRPLQMAALALASVGIVWSFVVVGSIPWVALVLGATFAIYGLVRKVGPWDAVDGLTFETTLLAPIGLIVLIARSGGSDITGDGEPVTLLLIALAGLVTVVPLLLFASAVKQVSLSTVGLLQYINPTLQFLVGWYVFGEAVSAGRLFGFLWIWVALALVVFDELRSKRPVDRVEPVSTQRLVGS